MERLSNIAIEVTEDQPDETGRWRRELVGDQAREWLRDHNALGDDPRVEQDRAREMSLVLMAARDNQAERACQNPNCEGCQVFERGFAWLVGTLPERYQRAVREYTFLNHAVASVLNRRRN